MGSLLPTAAQKRTAALNTASDQIKAQLKALSGLNGETLNSVDLQHQVLMQGLLIEQLVEMLIARGVISFDDFAALEVEIAEAQVKKMRRRLQDPLVD